MSGKPIPTVAIVGRPNVGKSTLFNRLLGKRKAITLDTPGVTRDPISEEVSWRDRRLRLVDTGGLGGESDIELADRVHEHTLQSVRGADLVVVVFDVRGGLSPLDRDTVDLLQRLEVPTIFVANKADSPTQEEAVVDFCRLGIDAPLAVSAEHGIGIDILRDEILERMPGEPASALDGTGQGAAAAPGDADLSGPSGPAGAGGYASGAAESEPATEGPDAETTPTADKPCRVAIVGRPNVGKSSLLNAIAGEDLALVDASPGTTRDVVDSPITRHGRRYLLLDTAGMRRPSKVARGVEQLSVGRTLEAVRRADVVLLLVEPEEGITDQDARIARFAWEEGRAVVLMMNKIDLVAPGVSHDSLRSESYRRYPTLSVIPMGFMSVREGRGVEQVFAAIDSASAAHRLQVQTAVLNRILAEAATRREPPVISGGRVRFFYATQTAVRPPTFALFVNRETVPTDYTRFLERCFRENLPLAGTPVRLRYRRRPSHGRDRA